MRIMPNRILKDSINESRGLTSCSFFAQDLYKRLITYADDYGRFNADPQIMVARLYPRELSVVSVEDLNEGLIELVGVGKIGFYTSSPRKEVYGAFPNWSDHQRLRDSKKKNPDPTDTAVNDWYLRRFIPIEMKIAIIERDGFKCKLCGKHIAETTDAKRLVKMGTGMFHVDHIVPCQQGGRATMENLRLTCPRCNQTRKKTFSYDEILQFAANGGELPQAAESSGLNPIQSESESETKTKAKSATAPDTDRRFEKFWSVYPRHEGKQDARKAFDKLKVDDALLETMVNAILKQKQSDQWSEPRYIPHPSTWLNGHRWEDEPTRAVGSKPKLLRSQDYHQRQYNGSDMEKTLGVDELYTEDVS